MAYLIDKPIPSFYEVNSIENHWSYIKVMTDFVEKTLNLCKVFQGARCDSKALCFFSFFWDSSFRDMVNSIFQQISDILSINCSNNADLGEQKSQEIHEHNYGQ